MLFNNIFIYYYFSLEQKLISLCDWVLLIYIIKYLTLKIYMLKNLLFLVFRRTTMDPINIQIIFLIVVGVISTVIDTITLHEKGMLHKVWNNMQRPRKL